MKHIQAILFDFDGTLRHNAPDAHHFFFDHAASLGAVDSPENRRLALRWAHQYWSGRGGIVSDVLRYGRETPAFWLNYALLYLQAFNCPDDQAGDLAPVLARHMDEMYLPADRIDADTPAFLEGLRLQGYILGVVSNRSSPFRDLVESIGLTGYFDFVLAAGEVQSWKPEPEIFRHAVERAGVRAAESVYVGDNYYADIVGAREAGLHPVLLDPEIVFPEADCDVIDVLPALNTLLNGSPATEEPSLSGMHRRSAG